MEANARARVRRSLTGVQLKDKWRNLIKFQHLRKDEAAKVPYKSAVRAANAAGKGGGGRWRPHAPFRLGRRGGRCRVVGGRARGGQQRARAPAKHDQQVPTPIVNKKRDVPGGGARSVC